MQDQHIEAVGKGLLIDFMNSNGIEPIEDSFSARYDDSPHVIIEMAGDPTGAIVYVKLMKQFERFINKRNAISTIKWCPTPLRFSIR